MPSLYETLGVEKSSSQEDIRKAFLKLARTTHPDKGGDPEKFKEISRANEILSDETKRAIYDQTGQIPGEEVNQPGPGPQFNPFGGGGASDGQLRGLLDNFTNANNTSLSSHIGDSNYGWVAQFGVAITTQALIFNNRLYSTSANNIYRHNYVISTPDYQVSAQFKALTGSSGGGINGRCQADANTYYTLRYLGGSWAILRVLAGNAVNLGNFAVTYADGADVNAILWMQGSTIKAIIDGVEVISVTDANITTAGSMGIRMPIVSTETTGWHLDWIEARAII
jgi:curved DNA-binding protein CbpA